MQNWKHDALLYELLKCNIEIEIDFAIYKERELTWHITVQFLTKDNSKLIKSLYFNKKNMPLKSAIREVYFETNNDLLLRSFITEFKIPEHFLEDDTYIDEIYPMIQHLRTKRDSQMTNTQKRLVFQNTKYL